MPTGIFTSLRIPRITDPNKTVPQDLWKDQKASPTQLFGSSINRYNASGGKLPPSPPYFTPQTSVDTMRMYSPILTRRLKDMETRFPLLDVNINTALADIDRYFGEMSRLRVPLPPDMVKMAGELLAEEEKNKRMAQFYRDRAAPLKRLPEYGDIPVRQNVPLPDLTPSRSAREGAAIAAGIMGLLGGGVAIPEVLSAGLREDEKFDQARREAYRLAVEEAGRQYDDAWRTFEARAKIADKLNEIEYENEKAKFLHDFQLASVEAAGKAAQTVQDEILNPQLDAQERYNKAVNNFKSSLERLKYLSDFNLQFKKEFSELLGQFIELQKAIEAGNLTRAQSLLTQFMARKAELDAKLDEATYPTKVEKAFRETEQIRAQTQNLNALTFQNYAQGLQALALVDKIRAEMSSAGKGSPLAGMASLLNSIGKNFDVLGQLTSPEDFSEYTTVNNQIAAIKAQRDKLLQNATESEKIAHAQAVANGEEDTFVPFAPSSPYYNMYYALLDKENQLVKERDALKTKITSDIFNYIAGRPPAAHMRLQSPKTPTGKPGRSAPSLGNIWNPPQPPPEKPSQGFWQWFGSNMGKVWDFMSGAHLIPKGSGAPMVNPNAFVPGAGGGGINVAPPKMGGGIPQFSSGAQNVSPSSSSGVKKPAKKATPLSQTPIPSVPASVTVPGEKRMKSDNRVIIMPSSLGRTVVPPQLKNFLTPEENKKTNSSYSLPKTPGTMLRSKPPSSKPQKVVLPKEEKKVEEKKVEEKEKNQVAVPFINYRRGNYMFKIKQ